MPRGDRNWPDVYFGRPGALVKMPYPREGMDKPYERMVYDFQTGSGQHLVSSMLGGSRPYTLGWRALHIDTYRWIEQYWLGAMGAGPWAFVDPSMPNLLLPNQAAATNYWATARDFSGNGFGALISNDTPSQIHRTGGTRSLRWYFAAAPGGASYPVLTFSTPYRAWWGTPVVPGLPYQFSAWLKPDGVVDTSITAAIKMQWLDTTGQQVGAELSGGDIPTSAWTRHVIGGVAPAGAAYAKPLFVLTGSSILAGASMYFDEFMLEQDTVGVVNAWAPTPGMRPVEILNFNDPVPFNARFRKGLSLTLRELAP